MTPTIDFELVRLLTQVGLLASWSGMHDHAERILRGAAAATPDVAQIHNTLGLALFAAGKREEAVRCLTETVERFPADAMARATLAFVLKQLGRAGWPLLAESVDGDGEAYEAVWLARHTLGLDPEPPRGQAAPVALAGGSPF